MLSPQPHVALGSVKAEPEPGGVLGGPSVPVRTHSHVHAWIPGTSLSPRLCPGGYVVGLLPAPPCPHPPCLHPQPESPVHGTHMDGPWVMEAVVASGGIWTSLALGSGTVATGSPLRG